MPLRDSIGNCTICTKPPPPARPPPPNFNPQQNFLSKNPADIRTATGRCPRRRVLSSLEIIFVASDARELRNLGKTGHPICSRGCVDSETPLPVTVTAMLWKEVNQRNPAFFS